ncbi:response regulator [Paraburkholderia hospita]|nr:response regulator [Paraburkholderia hospita]
MMANILLVDDDLESLWALQLALEANGHRVMVVEDAGRALDLLRREPVHFMITDYEMPIVDGAQLCRTVRAWGAHSSLPIVMLSAAPEPVSAPRAWTYFLRKPAGFGTLSGLIDAHVAPRLTGVKRVSVEASLRCAQRAASRWPAIIADCWP